MIAKIGLAAAGGTGLGYLTAKGITKLTGKPTGIKGTPMHILTNDKLDKEAKEEVAKEINKQQLKDLGQIGALSTIAGCGAVIASGCSKKALNRFKNTKNNIANFADKIKIGSKSLAQKVADTGLYKKIKTLPGPAKAGIMAAAGVIASMGIFLPIKAVADASKIETKAEIKAEAETICEAMAEAVCDCE